MHHKIPENATLLIVDIQNDFCFGGSLAVPDANSIIPVVNRLQSDFKRIIATQDWHPANHLSFITNHELQGIQHQLWPPHCIQHTFGAELHAELDKERIEKIIYKGIDKHIDSYSAFYDNAHSRSTGLGEYLLLNQVTDIYIVGLAMDYCVKYSCLDAIKLGFRVSIISDASRAIHVSSTDVANCFKELGDAGVNVLSGINFKRA